MKITAMFLSIAVAALATGCANSTTDDANDAAGTADAYLAREVVAVHLLTTDYRYNKICNFMEEGFVEEAFELGPTTEMNVTESLGGCRYDWKGGEVSVAFGNQKPYPSIYKAEYEFDKMYQPQLIDSMATSPVAALSGPAPQGTASSAPAIATAEPKPEQPAVIDSTNGTNEVTTKLTQPVYSTPKGVAVPNVGDKALWDANTSTLHVLFLNHVINMTVKTNKTEATKQKQAVMMMQVIVDRIAKADE